MQGALNVPRLVNVGRALANIKEGKERKNEDTTSSRSFSENEDLSSEGHSLTRLDSTLAGSSRDAAPTRAASESQDEWAEIDIHDIVIQRMIGQGKFSEVFLGTLRTEPIAVKVVHNHSCWREVCLLRTVNHNNVIRMHHAALMDGSCHIVMELCTGGSLFHLLHEQRTGGIEASWPQRMRICTDVSSAMEYLHGRKPQILHRDLKSLNLLLARPLLHHHDLPKVKVADLGLSRTLKATQGVEGPDSDKSFSTSKSHDRMTMEVGTAQWMAPEVHMSESYNEKVDVYSFAMVLYEVAWQRIPFFDEENRSSFSVERVILGVRPDISRLPPGCPEELPALIKVCWARSPAGRPRFSKVYPWLKAVAAEKGYNKWTVAL